MTVQCDLAKRSCDFPSPNPDLWGLHPCVSITGSHRPGASGDTMTSCTWSDRLLPLFTHKVDPITYIFTKEMQLVGTHGEVDYEYSL